jgi:hypothetical protein
MNSEDKRSAEYWRGCERDLALIEQALRDGRSIDEVYASSGGFESRDSASRMRARVS